ncbi:MAG: tetratricopeptide repeat protein [Acidobacteriota bacterium]
MLLRTGVVVFLFASIVGAGAGAAQIGFKQDERAMVQKYKASNAKLEQAKALFAKGKFDQAEAKIRDCLEMFPKNPDAQYLRAQIELRRGDLGPALASIEGAERSFTEIGQLYSFTHQEMMNDLREQKAKLEESIRAAEDEVAVLRGQPRSESTVSATAAAEGRMQQDKNLIAQIDRQLENPVPQTMGLPAVYHYIHGNILFKMKKFADAAREYQETVRLDPGHGAAYNNLASIYFAAGHYQQALDFLNQAEKNGVKVNPAFKKDLEQRLAGK